MAVSVGLVIHVFLIAGSDASLSARRWATVRFPLFFLDRSVFLLFDRVPVAHTVVNGAGCADLLADFNCGAIRVPKDASACHGHRGHALRSLQASHAEPANATPAGICTVAPMSVEE